MAFRTKSIVRSTRSSQYTKKTESECLVFWLFDAPTQQYSAGRREVDRRGRVLGGRVKTFNILKVGEEI